MQPVQKLQPLQSVICTPFVTAEFGGEQFGLRNKYDKRSYTRDIRYVTGLQINKKASGQVNTYTMNMTYVVEPGADPNYIDYIISQSSDRKILFSYGDVARPEYSYQKEQAMITKIVPTVRMSQSSIAYAISATSSVALSYAINRSYPARSAKPSTVILEVLNDPSNGLLELFTGMRDSKKVQSNGWIAANDKTARLEAKSDISPLEYIRFLVSEMSSDDGSFYAMVIHDEPDNIDGPYFEVINSTLYQGKGRTYSVEIDVGYPSDTPIFDFTPSQNTSLALITPFQEKMDFNRAIDINRMGEEIVASTPSLAIRRGNADTGFVNWWNTMTTYPVKASLKTRGLIRPSILCQYLHINVLFFGQPYTYSGYYMVTSQTDDLSTSGYTTTLGLVRVESLGS